MSKRQKDLAGLPAKSDYEVGYGKPPAANRFKPGQSGNPRSLFYDNLLEGWAKDGSFPLLYSRERILEHVAFRIRLRPSDQR